MTTTLADLRQGLTDRLVDQGHPPPDYDADPRLARLTEHMAWALDRATSTWVGHVDEAIAMWFFDPAFPTPECERCLRAGGRCSRCRDCPSHAMHAAMIAMETP